MLQLLIFFMATLVENPLVITSTAFNSDGFIPSKYSCEGDNINPPLHIQNIPTETKTLVLIVDDPDAPNGVFDHWVVWNIAPSESIGENSIPGVQGKNGFGKDNYGGPCPPSGTHRYFFKVYAIDLSLNLKEGASKKMVMDAIKGHILASGQLIGRYQKKKS